jgi:hypothetical protein
MKHVIDLPRLMPKKVRVAEKSETADPLTADSEIFFVDAIDASLQLGRFTGINVSKTNGVL